MRNMSPEDMKRQLEAAKSQGNAQQQYYFNVRRRRFRRLACVPC